MTSQASPTTDRPGKVLVTGSSGHLGEALVRTLRDIGFEAAGLDVKPSPFTTTVGSIMDHGAVAEAIGGVDTVFHTATLHKPHVATHPRRAFVDTNVTGTLTLLESAVTAGAKQFVFTSTTSVYGDAARPPIGSPAAWVTESLAPSPRNIYGMTKLAAEELCRLFHRDHGLPCIVLRTSRFFPEADDDPGRRAAFDDANLKANEYLFRRVELSDVVSAHLCARERAVSLGFRRFVISATTPLLQEDLAELNRNAAAVVGRRCPAYQDTYRQRGWRMLDTIDRVYVNRAARQELGWSPAYDFDRVLADVGGGRPTRSPLAELVGAKGYHDETFTDGPYPVG